MTETTNSIKVIRYRTDEGTVTGLQVGEGPKWIRVILMDAAGIHERKLPAEEGRWITELQGYPVERALKIFRKCARRFNGGLSGSLRQTLGGAK